MSYVTSVTISVTYASPDFEAEILTPSYFSDHRNYPDGFGKLDMNAAGGSKYPGHDVYAVGINYCDREALRAWVDALPWSDLTTGVVLVDTEGNHAEVWTYGAPTDTGA